MSTSWTPAVLVAAIWLISGEVQAASLEISPIAVNLPPGHHAAVIDVSNRGGPAAIQLRAYAWTQIGDEDVLTPTQDIILSPPIFTVAAGEMQTIRLLVRGGARTAGERNYRLLLDEVPPANTQKQQVFIAMRVSMPVMVGSSAPAAGTLRWRATRAPGGQISLSATNTGPVYDSISSIALTLADGSHRSVVSRSQSPYILAGAERHWNVQGDVPAGELQLSLSTRAGKSEQTLILAP